MMRLWIVFVVCVLKCSAVPRSELDDFSDYLFQTSQLDLNVKKAPDADFYDEDEEISDHAWEQSGKFEGDLILNDRQRRLIIENVEGLSRNGLTDSSKRWPNNELIYYIQKEHFNSDQIDAIQRGIEDLAEASCVKFRPFRKGDRDAVVIQGNRRGCFSNVGYQGGFQVLNLSGRHPAGRGCFRHGTVIHELLHSLGFFHMQSSPDRDDYITVLWENILQSTRHNFRKYNTFSVSDFGVGYDYDSVLHYGRRAFSSNGKDTLVPKQRGVSIGQRTGLSEKDTVKLNKMYCDSDLDNEAEENPNKKKKKKPNNLPFGGHGIGYHQGKTVVIKLPATESVKLPDVSPIDTFDYYDNAPKSVSLTDAGVYGEEGSYPYRTSSLLNMMRDTPDLNKEQADRNKALAQWASSTYSDPEAYSDKKEESLTDTYERLGKTIKENVYPQSGDYPYKINKDYSQFFTPAEYKPSATIRNLDERFGPSKAPPHILTRKPVRVTQEQENGLPRTQGFENIDSSYRTAFPTKIPYSVFEQTETPNYATREYLKDRQNFDHLYSARNIEQFKEHPSYKDDESSTEDGWYKKDSSRPSSSYPISYTDYVTMEHKSNEPSRRPSSDEEDGYGTDKENISGDYSDEKAESPQKSQPYSNFATTVPLSDSWYKPVYLNLDKMPNSSSEESQEDS